METLKLSEAGSQLTAWSDILMTWALTSGLRLLVIVVAAMVLLRLGRKFVSHTLSLAVRHHASDPIADALATKRRDTLTHLFTNILGTVIIAMALLMGLRNIGFDIAPILAGAGVVGVAIGFGAQALVKDVITGAFVILEDQYGVGDVVKLGDASGKVEEINLRTTVLRDGQGTRHIIPNGEISRASVMTRGWGQVLLDIDVAYDTDLDQALSVLSRVLETFSKDHPQLLLSPPEVLGVETLGDNSITLRSIIKTTPGDHWGVRRKLQKLVKEEFDRHKIEIPFPQRTVWLKNENVDTPGSLGTRD